MSVTLCSVLPRTLQLPESRESSAVRPPSQIVAMYHANPHSFMWDRLHVRVDHVTLLFEVPCCHEYGGKADGAFPQDIYAFLGGRSRPNTLSRTLIP